MEASKTREGGRQQTKKRGMEWIGGESKSNHEVEKVF
jgi:hypothetical protein